MCGSDSGYLLSIRRLKNRKHGFSPVSIQRYGYRGCEHVFQLKSINYGSEPTIRERTIQLKIEGMEFRAMV